MVGGGRMARQPPTEAGGGSGGQGRRRGGGQGWWRRQWSMKNIFFKYLKNMMLRHEIFWIVPRLGSWHDE
jgi:hypothetical protein